MNFLYLLRLFFSNPPTVCPRFSQLTLCELGLVDRTRRTSVLRVLETRSPLRSAFSGTDPNGGFLRVRPPSSLGFGGRNGRHRTWRVVWRPVLRQTPGALRGGSLGALERFQGSGSRWSWWGRWEWNTGAAWSRGGGDLVGDVKAQNNRNRQTDFSYLFIWFFRDSDMVKLQG